MKWQSIKTAPKNQEIIVYCTSFQDQPHMVSLCRWHPDAGFCVDELRHPVAWIPLDLFGCGSEDKLSMRDQFAVAALNIIGQEWSDPKTLAVNAYAVADAVLIERAKQPK